jgi:uncharacterized protein YceK
MKKNTLVLLGMATSMVLMSGCATIISGKTQVVDVTSKTTKTFSIDGQEYQTPAKVHLHRSKDDKVISVNGCNEDIPLKSSMNPVVIGNILAGGLLGSTTDLAGGAGWKYDDNITLDCK